MVTFLRIFLSACCIVALCANVEAQVASGVQGASPNSNGQSLLRQQARTHRHRHHRQLTAAERAKLMADQQAVAADAQRVRADKSAGNSTRLKADEIQLRADMQVLRGDYRLFSHQGGASSAGRNLQQRLNRHHGAAPPVGETLPAEADEPAQS